MTDIIKMSAECVSASLKNAADALRDGGLVAFPTETVYGLGANAFDENAVANIFTAKGRPQDNPLIVHISNTKMLSEIVSFVPPSAKAVIDSFWPGPLTVIMKKNSSIPDIVTAGLDTVAVRMPSHPVALQLIEESGVPVAAPSANTSGRPSPTCAEHVIEDLSGKIPYIIDGGCCDVGLESTVLDVTGDIPLILRPGGISIEQLAVILNNVEYDKGIIKEGAVPKSPGMKYRHYAPRAQMYIIEGSGALKKIDELIKNHRAGSAKIGVLTMSDRDFDADFVIKISDEPYAYAAALFSALRKFDSLGADIIFSETFSGSGGIKEAVKNRIYKAAGGRVIVC